MAAQLASAEPDTAQHFCFIAYTNLAQLDAGAEYSGQIFYQLTEIYTAVSSKEENNFAVIECVLYIN